MDELINYFSERPWHCLVVTILSFLVGTYFHQKAKVAKFALWVADQGQYQRLDERLLEEAIEESEYHNVHEQFMQFLVVVRVAVGHENVKIGHVYWIWDRIDNGVAASDLTAIPNFDEANPTDILIPAE